MNELVKMGPIEAKKVGYFSKAHGRASRKMETFWPSNNAILIKGLSRKVCIDFTARVFDVRKVGAWKSLFRKGLN